MPAKVPRKMRLSTVVIRRICWIKDRRLSRADTDLSCEKTFMGLEEQASPMLCRTFPGQRPYIAGWPGKERSSVSPRNGRHANYIYKNLRVLSRRCGRRGTHRLYKFKNLPT